MALVNTSKPTTSITNTVSVAFAEIWNTILTTWNSETRTWDATISLITDTAKPSTSITNTAKPV